jgi:UDP-GlcNAc:undecaprenyl-phosphate/decaprenyl-phosphate GlcNAc-1-phosphate transferase
VELAPHFTAFITGLVVSLAATPAVRALASRFNICAMPAQDRWHSRPIPLLGGIAIAIGLAAGVLISGPDSRFLPLFLYSGLMFALGVFDDIRAVKPLPKLCGQMAVAALVLWLMPPIDVTGWALLDRLLAFVWIVGVTNAFNLLDNMDGLAAGVAAIAAVCYLTLLLPGNASGLTLTIAAFTGAVLGFLVFNFPPATVFMGDSGSLLLGFSFAAVTLSSGRQLPGRSDVLSIVAAPVLVLLIPIFDTTLVTLSRWFSGRRASEGGRDHSSHRLVAIGLSERRAVALLWALAALGGMLGVALSYFSQSWSALAAAAAFLLGMILFAAYLAGIRVYDDADARVRQGAFTPIVVEFMYKRRVAEVLLDFCLIALCYYVAYRLRFEDPEAFMKNFGTFTRSLPVVLAVQLTAFFVVGVYRGVWRHFGMMDSLVVGRGVAFGALGAQLVILYVYHFFAYSRTVFVIYAVLLLIAMMLTRGSFRLVGEFVQRQRQSGRRVVIYGAGDAGGLVVRELLNGDAEQVRIVGFIDDDTRKAGIRVTGYPVLGGYSALTVLVKAASIDEVVVSARTMPPERLNNLQVLCAEARIRLARLHVGLEAIVDEDAGADIPARQAIRKAGS